MKPKIVYKTTAGVFKTEPLWFYYIMPVEVVSGRVHAHVMRTALLGVKQPLPKQHERFNPSIPYVSCETD